MKRRIPYAIISAIALTSAGWAGPLANPGEPLPATDARAVDRSGRAVSITTHLGDQGAAFLFVAADCPDALANAEHMAELLSSYQSKGVAVAIIEVTPLGTAATEPAAFSKLNYLVDEGGQLALSLGVLEVPEVLVLDGSGRIAYRGSPGEGERHELLSGALAAVIERRVPAVEKTPAVGCRLP
jgi:hypothetical protein